MYIYQEQDNKIESPIPMLTLKFSQQWDSQGDPSQTMSTPTYIDSKHTMI